jgi:His-Xaa-Ser system radical SAM maturase HxsC
MLTLGGKLVAIQGDFGTVNTREVWSVSENERLPDVLKAKKAFLVRGNKIPEGFARYLVLPPHDGIEGRLPIGASFRLLPEDYRYLGEGDVVRLSSDTIRVLFRAKANHNSLLVTEQCNNYCLMCSQPPKRRDDGWLLDEIRDVIRLIPRNNSEIGFTGGEPTLFGDDFLALIQLAKSLLPRTAVHVLSNGRRFADMKFAEKWATIDHPDLMVGIPIYSDDPATHDYVVQAKGAFEETVLGILNLKRLKQKVEIRVVLHKQNIERLAKLAEFIVRNLLFVDHVALMGLEMTGFTLANLDKLWIDPIEYKDKLSDAVCTLRNYGIRVSVYNHPLCLLNPDIGGAYRKSISDWKNEFASECDPCTRKADCGGFFSSGIRNGYSKSLMPFLQSL